MLRVDITRVMREYKAGEGVPCYSRLMLMSGSSLELEGFVLEVKKKS